MCAETHGSGSGRLVQLSWLGGTDGQQQGQCLDSRAAAATLMRLILNCAVGRCGWL